MNRDIEEENSFDERVSEIVKNIGQQKSKEIDLKVGREIIKAYPELIKEATTEPMGVSQWKEYGKKYGYWKYFEDEARTEVIEEIEKEIETYRLFSAQKFTTTVKERLKELWLDNKLITKSEVSNILNALSQLKQKE